MYEQRIECSSFNKEQQNIQFHSELNMMHGKHCSSLSIKKSESWMMMLHQLIETTQLIVLI